MSTEKQLSKSSTFKIEMNLLKHFLLCEICCPTNKLLRNQIIVFSFQNKKLGGWKSSKVAGYIDSIYNKIEPLKKYPIISYQVQEPLLSSVNISNCQNCTFDFSIVFLI